MTAAPAIDRWIADLEARHLRDLTPAEVARALRALSSTYVERRSRLTTRGAFDSAGKRAAYALYYGPRRFALLRVILTELAPPPRSLHTVHDHGCGSGAAGVAWATMGDPPAVVRATDRHRWAVEESRAALAAFGLPGDVRRTDIADLLPRPAPRGRPSAAAGSGDAIVLSYVVNELDEATRARVLPWLLDAADRGARVLVMEPLARTATPWWPTWGTAFLARGGRADEWKRAPALPPLTVALGRAAGLDVVTTSARTLWL
jgi:hypothetical protein